VAGIVLRPAAKRLEHVMQARTDGRVDAGTDDEAPAQNSPRPQPPTVAAAG